MLVENSAVFFKKVVAGFGVVSEPGLELGNFARLVKNQSGAAALAEHRRWSGLGRLDIVHVPLAELGALSAAELLASANYRRYKRLFVMERIVEVRTGIFAERKRGRLIASAVQPTYL